MTRSRLAVVLLLGTLLAASGGCAPVDVPMPNLDAGGEAVACTPGDTLACTCSDGAGGTRTCLAGGMVTGCACGDAAPPDVPGPTDTGLPADTGSLVDSGTIRDTGLLQDTGVPRDTGVPTMDVGSGGCSSPVSLGSRLGRPVTTGTNVGAMELVTPSCGSSRAPDVVFAWTAPRSGSFVFDTRGAAYDSVLAVMDGSCTGRELACNDDLSGSDQDSQVVVSLAAGQRVVIVVTGYSTNTGTFPLNIGDGALLDAGLPDVVVVDTGFPDIVSPPGDPQGRSRADVCARWTADRVRRATVTWTHSSATCDPGTIDPAALDDGMRMLNLYRWLTGTRPATVNPALARAQQECAVMESLNGGLSHMPPTSWTCYTAAGASQAGMSNLAAGTRMYPAYAVDLWVNEPDQELGHARWCLCNNLGPTTFGSTDRATCMNSFASSSGDSRAWIAFPNPGPAPIETTTGVWHAQQGTMAIGGRTTVEMRHEGTGAVLATARVSCTSTYGRGDCVAWRPNGWTPAADTTYRVTLSGGSGSPITYTVTPVRCL